MSEGKVDLVDTSFAYLTDIAMYKGIDDEKGFFSLAVTNRDPINYSEAMNTKNKIHWQKAIDDKFQSIHDNEVWSLMDRPTITSDGKRANIIDSRWVFKMKTDANGKKNFKARLVIRGFKDTNECEL